MNYAMPGRTDCMLCSLCQTRRHVVPNRIIPGCRIMFVAEAPGAEEDKEGIEPLIGKAGRYFRSVASNLSIDLNLCSLANICQCNPPGNRDPLPEEVSACQTWLWNDITEAHPSVIVALGAVAAKNLVDFKGSIKKSAGEAIRHERFPGIPVVLCPHPSAVLHEAGNAEAFLRGIRAAALYAGFASHVPIEDTNYRLVNDRAAFLALVEELEAAPVFAVDTESTGLQNLWNGSMLCLSYSTQERAGWVLPRYETTADTFAAYQQTKGKKLIQEDYEAFLALNHLAPPVLHPVWKETDLVERLKAVHKDPNKDKFMHNASHDTKWLKREGLEMAQPILDTMVGHYLLDGTKNTHGLEYLSEIVLKMPTYKQDSMQALLRDGDSFGFIPTANLYNRAVRDADSTLRLGLWLKVELEKKKMTTLWRDFVGPLSVLLGKIETKGMGFDLKHSKEDIQPHYEGLAAEAKKPLDAQFPGVNWRSSTQVADVLYKKLGLPIRARTEKGAPATGKDVLDDLADIHPFPKLLKAYKAFPTAISSFIIGYQDRVAPDGRIHQHLNQITTDTGRLSATDPNTQNVKNTDEDQGDAGLRSQFIAIPGRVLSEADLSKAEIVVAADESKDPAMVKALLDESEQIEAGKSTDEIIDFHDFTAMKVMHVSFADRRNKMIRKRAKRGTFLVLYGGEWPALMRVLDCTEVEAKDFIQNFRITYAGYMAWRAWLIQNARERGYVWTKFGRHRDLPNLLSPDRQLREEAERQAGNTPIQATASDLTCLAAIRIDNDLRGQFDFDTVNLVHDSIMWEVATEQVIDFNRAAMRIMEEPTVLSLPLRAEFGFGPHWGDIKNIERRILKPVSA
jgi:DNA polymerase-1